MSSFLIKVAPGLFVANSEAATTYYKSLKNHHANQQFLYDKLASHAEKEAKYKKQIEEPKETILLPEEALKSMRWDSEIAQASGLEDALEDELGLVNATSLQLEADGKKAKTSRLVEEMAITESENVPSTIEKNSVIDALQMQITGLKLELPQKKEEYEECKIKFGAADSANAELKRLQKRREERDTPKSETVQLENTIDVLNDTVAHLKCVMAELESEAAQLKPKLEKEKQKHEETRGLLHKEESAFDALQDKFDVIRQKLQDADDDYDGLVKENRNLLDGRRQAAEELEKLSVRHEKLQLDRSNSVYEVLEQTEELHAAKD